MAELSEVSQQMLPVLALVCVSSVFFTQRSDQMRYWPSLRPRSWLRLQRPDKDQENSSP